MAAEGERRAALEAQGQCPDSGYPIVRCWASVCDCAYAPPKACSLCGLIVWDIPDHRKRTHA